MKKQYINPTIYARKIVINNILAGSPDIITDDNGNATSTGSEDGDGLAKRSTWNDKDYWGDCWK